MPTVPQDGVDASATDDIEAIKRALAAQTPSELFNATVLTMKELRFLAARGARKPPPEGPVAGTYE